MNSAEELLQQLKHFAEEFAESTLGDYAQRLNSNNHIPAGPKEVNDPIWGTIKLSPLEVVVLDSPLVQRLRFVRQLGVVHWIYPGASHSRFEHTLGVLHQAQQLINAINQASGEAPTQLPITQQKADLVRLCALLHDIGHTVFSHVSEHVLSKRTDLRYALAAFAREHEIEKAQLSEAIAYFMIGSPAFVEVLTVALDKLDHLINLGHGSKVNAQKMSELCQKAIIGRMIDEEVPLLHEIITGPFDADKLDYYVRDAKHAGVPSIVDISRLTQKIAVKRVGPEELPQTISAAISETSEKHYLFGLKWSGASILDELHLARVLLYAKIYRHKKVQAVEAMIDALFEALGTLKEADVGKLIALSYEYTDDQLLWAKASDLAADIGTANVDTKLIAHIDDILERLRNRRLYVAALSVRAKYPSDPWGKDLNQNRGLTDLDGDLANTQKAMNFREDLQNEIESLFVSIPAHFGGLDIENVKRSVIVSAKPKLGGSTEIDRAFILQGEKMIAGRDLDRMNQPAWSSAYDFGTPSSIVFSPKECSAAVYVAAERHVRTKYGVVLPLSALEMSKQKKVEIDQLKRDAEKAGWYQGHPLDIRALPVRLTKADINPRVEKIAAKLESFDEPSIKNGQRRAAGTLDRIKGWLAQFRDDSSIEHALQLLENFRILKREDTYAALTAFLEKHPEFENAIVCPFGDAKDSGSVQGYFSTDLQGIRTAISIEKAAEQGLDGPIIMLDDFIGSGVQAKDILGNWFDQSELKTETLGEVRLPFTNVAQDYLRERKSAFVFVAGWKKGLNDLTKALGDLSLDSEVYGHLTDDDLPFAFTGGDSQLDTEDAKKFEDRCRHIGEDLQKSAGKVGKDVKERALGYGNRGMLLASGLNVPTQTLTCIWRDGKVDGADWHALLRRRNKQ